MREQVKQGGVKGIAEGPPASGIRVAGAEGKDGWGRKASGQEEASAAGAGCAPLCTEVSPSSPGQGSRGTHRPGKGGGGGAKKHTPGRGLLSKL